MKAKRIKLTKGYVLGKAGFNFGLRIAFNEKEFFRIKTTVEEKFGPGWGRWNGRLDRTWGYYRSHKSYGNYIDYIGFKNETDLIYLLLSLKES
jgi:hypothetical protein